MHKRLPRDCLTGRELASLTPSSLTPSSCQAVLGGLPGGHRWLAVAAQVASREDRNTEVAFREKTDWALQEIRRLKLPFLAATGATPGASDAKQGNTPTEKCSMDHGFAVRWTSRLCCTMDITALLYGGHHGFAVR
eukprot:314074-Chlamydomonas_euryale.AAC.2